MTEKNEDRKQPTSAELNVTALIALSMIVVGVVAITYIIVSAF